jgi:NAD(P)-dependent dehydrogenase (short-subunit alcohol dehydrogenase family)
MSADKLAIVAGAGGAIGPALAHALNEKGYRTVGIARRAPDVGFAHNISADLTDPVAAQDAYAAILSEFGAPSVLIYNAHKFLIESFAQTSITDFEDVWRTDTLGAFIAAKALLPAMCEQGGTILFSGATASTRGSANFSAFASAKFALRGLAQSLAREYAQEGIHIAHIVIDGLIAGGHAQKSFKVSPSDCISPAALAAEYMNLISQPQNAWTHEVDIRPFKGKF